MWTPHCQTLKNVFSVPKSHFIFQQGGFLSDLTEEIGGVTIWLLFGGMWWEKVSRYSNYRTGGQMTTIQRGLMSVVCPLIYTLKLTFTYTLGNEDLGSWL